MAPLTVLRPLRFPSHRWLALVCVRTGRVLAFVPAVDPSLRDAPTSTNAAIAA